jgi:hypothetical protein
LSPGNAFYNITIAHRVSAGIDARRLDQALTALAARHEALRTVFDERDGERCNGSCRGTGRCAVVDLGDHRPSSANATSSESLRTKRKGRSTWRAPRCIAPSWFASAVRVAFIFVVHQIVADSWSMEIILRDLGALYAGTAAPGDAGPRRGGAQYVTTPCGSGRGCRESVSNGRSTTGGVSSRRRQPSI